MSPLAELVMVYTDGGLAGLNPSPIGGAWAYRYVVADVVMRERAGTIRPAAVGLAAIGNNLSELIAIVAALEGLADGRHLLVLSDSENALGRVFRHNRMKNVPTSIVDRLRAQQQRLQTGRLHCEGYVLLDGHPSRAQLAAGKGKRGRPVSVHNVAVDARCTKECAALTECWITEQMGRTP